MRLLLFSFSAFILHAACRFTDETDRQALLEFKSQVSEGKRDVLSSWNNSFPLCNWKWVICGSKHKRVIGLELGGLQLGGVISPSIGNLSFLISLDLSNNSFGGTIPQEVGKLFRLEYLYMSSNVLRGGIPTSLFNCSRLLDLHLYTNPLGGGVPSELGSLKKLVVLDIGRNNLKGKLPASLGNLTSLMQLSLGGNNLEGALDNIGRLSQMTGLILTANNFSGSFPSAIYNMSSLEYLNVFLNDFSGRLRPDLGNLLPKLRVLYIGKNDFTGSIPTTLANISTLQELRMEFNSLTGSIPPSFGKLQNMQTLALHANYFGSYSDGDLEFFNALLNCSHLLILSVGSNKLGGDLPSSIANMSTNLIELSLGGNHISGSVPRDIGNIIHLQILQLYKNLLSGPLPTSVGKLSELGVLSVFSNRMSGKIPSSIGNITRLVKLYLSDNSLEGVIPPSLGKCSNLLYLHVGSNKLNGTIPREIMQIQPLVLLDMSRNSLIGSLPNHIAKLEHIGTLSVAHNKLSGQLPQGLGKCLLMENLYLRGNSFYGEIPDIRGLVGLKRVDLSNNNLSGSIPGYLASFPLLEYMNLSNNNFEGRVPIEGKFKNSSIVSVYGNNNLCGGIKVLKLKPCFEIAPQMDRKHPSLLKKVLIGVSTTIAFILLLVITSLSLRWFIKRRKKNLQTDNPTPSALETFHGKISYREIRSATDGFSLSNLIGSGSFGTVFKVLLPTMDKVVAVKVLNMERRGAKKSFMAECESLKIIRHRNLVKLLTACSSIDYQGNEFRALIYEFMPHGSVDMWLHPEEVEDIGGRPLRTLTLFERLNIVIDVASVLDYLHVQCHEPIAHCDLKPSNVLLDDDFTAHVSDFGLARLLLKFDEEYFLNQLSSAGVRGTIGYAAPEYGMGGQPSIHGDRYSFGVLLLEMFTGKRPTSEMFEGNYTLHSYTKSALPDQVLDIIDNSMLHSGLRVGFPVVECLTLILEVGLRCCEESPTNRLSMSEAEKELISVRERFFKCRKTA